jgi:hypothetical protein
MAVKMAVKMVEKIAVKKTRKPISCCFTQGLFTESVGSARVVN